MHRMCDVPAPIVTYSFPFQMAILDEISLGLKKTPTNREQSSVEMAKESMTGGENLFHIS